MKEKNDKKVRVSCPFVQAVGGIVIATGLMLGAVGKVRNELLEFGLGVGLVIGGMIFILFLDGFCSAEDEGLTIEMPFRKPRFIPYDEIEWVSLDVKSGGRRSKCSSAVNLIHIIKIVTRDETLTFRRQHGWADSRSMLSDPRQRGFLTMNSPFAEIERTIKRNKGMDITPDFLKQFIPPDKARRLR